MQKYVYAILDDNKYDIDETFDDAEKAIYAAMCGQEVAVLDAMSLEYIGYIN